MEASKVLRMLCLITFYVLQGFVHAKIMHCYSSFRGGALANGARFCRCVLSRWPPESGSFTRISRSFEYARRSLDYQLLLWNCAVGHCAKLVTC